MKTSWFSKAKTALLTIGKLYGDRNVGIYAAAAVYFLFMSLVPILMLLVSLVRYLPFSEADVMAVFKDAVPESVFTVINNIVSGIYRNGGAAFTVSLALTLFSASGAMRPLMKCLDAIYGDVRRDKFPLFFLKAILYMGVLVVFMILNFAILVFGGAILDYLNALLPGNATVGWLLGYGMKLLRYALVMLILTCGFLLLYCRVPAKKRRIATQWPGAVFSAFAWVVFSWIFSIYISFSDKFGAYGYIGTIMVAMMWGYYCMMFLLLGGCINVYYEHQKKRKESME